MEIDRQLVRRSRQDRGWTQQQLAEIANLSLRTVQRVENQGVGSHETVSTLIAALKSSATSYWHRREPRRRGRTARHQCG